MNRLVPESCSCEICQSACHHTPGWFAPGEVEKVAQFLGISLDELFKKYLTVDSWELDHGSIDVLIPGVISEETGIRNRSLLFGTCVFLKGGLCAIHAVKPYECKMATHSGRSSGDVPIRKEIGESWVEFQMQIERLLYGD